MAYERRSSATPNDASKMLQGIRRPRGARLTLFFAISTSISPALGTSAKRPRFVRHSFRDRHGKSRFAFD